MPIPKCIENDPRIPLNYRGINLLSCVFKVYSAVINKRVTHYLDTNKLLVDEQNGFRKQRSCTDHVYSLNAIIKNKLNAKKSVFASFIDLKKAFDCVNRDMLYFKLLQIGINGKVFKTIRNMYSNTLSAVILGSYITDWFDTDNGVRQGDTLSPTLFAIYINDLVTELNNLN